jgi:hypothetical protein
MWLGLFNKGENCRELLLVADDLVGVELLEREANVEEGI